MKNKPKQMLRAFAVALIAIAATALSSIATVAVSTVSAAETLISKSVDTKKPVTIHVSPQGNDENDGSEANPIASLEAARAHARMVRGTIVIIHGGTYRLERPLEFTHEDDGVEFRAAPGEKVVITSDRMLELKWQPFRDGLWQYRRCPWSEHRRTASARLRRRDDSGPQASLQDGLSLRADFAASQIATGVRA